MTGMNYTITIACKGEPAGVCAMWLAISSPKNDTDERQFSFGELASLTDKDLGSFSSSSVIDPDAALNSIQAEDSSGKPEQFYPVLAKAFPALKFFIVQECSGESGAEICSYEAKNGRMRLSGKWEYARLELCEARRAWLGALQGHWLCEGGACRETSAEISAEEAQQSADHELARAEKQTSAMCLEAVQADGGALAYVRKQTPKICLAAVENSGLSLRFVKNQTAKICRAAIEQNPFALYFVNNQTRELCRAALKQNYLAYGCVRETSASLFRLFNETFEEEIQRLTNSGH